MPNIFNADNGAVSGSAGIKLSSDTSGVLNIQTNGTTAISISSSQVVSFPSTTSIGTLYFAAGTAAAPSISVTGDTNTGIYFPAADTIAFTEGGVESMRLTSTGQIAASTDGTASAPVFTRSSDLDTGQWFPTANTLAWSTGGSERMRINSSGNVGIGTSAPNAALTIGGGSPRISFFDGDPTYSVYRSSTTMALSSSGPILLAAGSGGTITFTNSAARMHITVGGNIGIGTIDPGATLDVAGNARSNAWIGRANVSAPTADAAVYRAADNTLAFSTANTERARIDSAGNMGLGVTPSAWSSFGPALQMQYGAIKAGYFNSTNNQISVLNNAFEAADTSYKYIVSTNKASMYKQIEGAHQWHTAAGGTAGNTITFTQAMTLDSGGSLGVGTTSPGSIIHAQKPNGSSCYLQLGQVGVESWQIGMSGGSSALAFLNSGTERARITSGGDFCVSATSIRSALGSNTKATIKGAAIGSVGTGGTNALDTGISINQADGGLTLLLLASRNTSAGTSTDSALYIIRFYYDGNNAPTTTFVGGSSNFVTFGTSGSNTLTLTNSGDGNAAYSWFSSR